jgi:AraC-like DNA-binding protein
MFDRVWSVIRQGYADPDLGPLEVATRTGISLRYLQKLFTQRGSTCSEMIYSLRLDHAARLVGRRGSLRNAQPLSEIAYACGFRDYTHFARKFRHRFGHPPGAHSANNDRGDNADGGRIIEQGTAADVLRQAPGDAHGRLCLSVCRARLSVTLAAVFVRSSASKQRQDLEAQRLSALRDL